MVHEVTKKIRGEPNPSPQLHRNSLRSFFRNGSEANDEQQETASGSADAELELICRLPPAKCFRAELNRTLTCHHCGYSRKQTETFYDFSLDLPYYPVSDEEPTAEQEPTAEREPQASPSLERRCFCNLVPQLTGEGDDRYYCCSKSSCSFREKSVDGERSTTSPTKLAMAGVKSAASSLSPASRWPPRPAPIELETLLRKQFDAEMLELTCEKCHVGKEAESAYEVKSLPSILVLHLKRFEVHPHTGLPFKRCDLVVPPAVIDPVRSIDDSSLSRSEQHYVLKVRSRLQCTPTPVILCAHLCLYVSQSVIHHLGKSIDEGHYVADVCDAHGQWIRRNDTHEAKVRADSVRNGCDNANLTIDCFVRFRQTMRSNRIEARSRVTCFFMSNRREVARRKAKKMSLRIALCDKMRTMRMRAGNKGGLAAMVCGLSCSVSTALRRAAVYYNFESNYITCSLAAVYHYV